MSVESFGLVSVRKGVVLTAVAGGKLVGILLAGWKVSYLAGVSMAFHKINTFSLDILSDHFWYRAFKSYQKLDMEGDFLGASYTFTDVPWI